MSECVGNYFVLNGELLPCGLFDPSLVYEGESVYEVIRVVKGVPVFFADHYRRLEASAGFQKKPVLAGEEDLKHYIKLLLSADRKKNINLKIVFNYNKARVNKIVYYVEPVYPTEDQYRYGVPAIIYHAERKNPESKVINHKLRSEIYHRLINENAYEALLVNNHNCITEGSRSNVFFIKDDMLFTAPDREVLGGITRMHIIEICRDRNIEIEFGCIDAGGISQFESAFMSGTSPVVLPYSRIGGITFNVRHRYLPLLRKLYMEKAAESMKEFQ